MWIYTFSVHVTLSVMEINYINQCMSESMAILHAFFMYM